MKLNKFSNLLTFGLVVALTAAGCKTKPTPITPIPGSRSGVRSPGPMGDNSIPSAPAFVPASGPGTTLTGGGPLGPGHEGWVADPQALKPQTIYFDFDKSAIKASEAPKLEEVASYLRSHPGAALRVEGNCDERGTEEYNRALGERRALAAREKLVEMGIPADSVDTVSYGEDKPAVPGHNEATWSKNRRDDFVVLTRPSP